MLRDGVDGVADVTDLAAMLLHDFLLLALPVSFFFSVAFIVLLFTFSETDLALDSAIDEMHVQRNHRVSGAFYFADQLADFCGMQQ